MITVILERVYSGFWRLITIKGNGNSNLKNQCFQPFLAPSFNPERFQLLILWGKITLKKGRNACEGHFFFHDHHSIAASDRTLHLLSNSLTKLGRQPLKFTCPGTFSLALSDRQNTDFSKILGISLHNYWLLPKTYTFTVYNSLSYCFSSVKESTSV